MADVKDTVPAGAIKQGEKFTPTEMEVDKAGKNVPVTQNVIVEREGGKKVVYEVTTN